MTDTVLNKPDSHRGGKVWIEFRGHRRAVFSNPYEFPFRSGDTAIVEADRGEDAGRVIHVIGRDQISGEMSPEFSVIRRANSRDLDRINWLKEREKQALQTFKIKVNQHNLPMNLVDIEYRFDGLKLTFYFTADGRVDFRELVRDLAGTFRTRIELRQIGARDETKRWDGFGVCGRRLCCVSFLNSFQPITTHMAKLQNLILNPSKLSGLCSRLKCCLSYEFSHYESESDSTQSISISDSDGSMDDLDKLSD